MSNSVQSLQAVNALAQTEQTVQPPEKPKTTPQASTPQDKVTISQSAKQALADNTKQASGGDVGNGSA